MSAVQRGTPLKAALVSNLLETGALMRPLLPDPAGWRRRAQLAEHSVAQDVIAGAGTLAAGRPSPAGLPAPSRCGAGGSRADCCHGAAGSQ